MSKGRPKVTIRMNPEEIAHLKGAAALYGAADVASFAREMFESMLSGDAVRRMNFAHGLALKLGEQLTLPLVDKPVIERGTRKKRTARTARKKRSTRDRTT